MTMAIFITAIIIVALLAIFIKTRQKKQQIQNSNPVDGLHFGGMMGFLLGDSYDFCLSRMKHLKIVPDSNDYDNELRQAIWMDLPAYVTFGTDQYNNVKEVSMRFDKKVLTSISIDIDYSAFGIIEMYGMLHSRLCRILGKESEIETEEFCKWFSNRGNIYLSIFKDKDSSQLLIQVLKD